MTIPIKMNIWAGWIPGELIKIASVLDWNFGFRQV